MAYRDKEKANANRREWYRKNRKHRLAWQYDWMKKNPEKVLLYRKKYRKNLKTQVLEHYGGKPARCVCCREEHLEFLCLDHIEGGGTAHRKEVLGLKRGTDYYMIIKSLGYPDWKLRVLCQNCNAALAFYNYCPHRQKKISSKKLSGQKFLAKYKR